MVEQLCNRSACRAPGAGYWNTSTRAWYCEKCAKAINEGAGCKIIGVPLCLSPYDVAALKHAMLPAPSDKAELVERIRVIVISSLLNDYATFGIEINFKEKFRVEKHSRALDALVSALADIHGRGGIDQVKQLTDTLTQCRDTLRLLQQGIETNITKTLKVVDAALAKHVPKAGA